MTATLVATPDPEPPRRRTTRPCAAPERCEYGPEPHPGPCRLIDPVTPGAVAALRDANRVTAQRAWDGIPR